MTDEQRKQVDELIVGADESYTAARVIGPCCDPGAMYARSAALSSYAAAIMLREMLDKPKEPK